MRQLRMFICVFMLWTLIGTVSKIAFFGMYGSLFEDTTLWEKILVIVHGLKLDVAIAGYLTLIPTILLGITLWWQGKLMIWIWKVYFAFTSLVTSLMYVTNLGLYGYWGFPLDNTPLLYIKTSPTDAMASLTWWQMMAALLAVTIVTAGIYYLFRKSTNMLRLFAPDKRRTLAKCSAYTVVLLVLGGTLIIPIRGGFETGTNHTGTVYFSQNMRLNHAAVNPIFCFVESVSHQRQKLSTMYRFMDAEKADSIFSTMTHTALRTDVSKHNYNVVLISLEGFSDSIMHVPGVTTYLNRLAEEAVYFPNFYANSTRTDRALTCIHSGLPAQPTMSIMDLPKKSTALPSIARTLSRNGYATVFYYGGDINYSNMQSYFIGTGFQHIVSLNDFPLKLRRCKWGVADEDVYSRLLEDLRNVSTEKPFFYSLMTESSHEPYDVPNYRRLSDERLNAFAYADECLGKFIASMRTLPCWKNTIVVIVSDHLGVYPENIDNYQLWRYHIPLVITGGAMSYISVTDEKRLQVASQIDISATLLGMLGIRHDEFIFSKDILDATSPHFAFFSFPDAMGLVTSNGSCIYDNVTKKCRGTSEYEPQVKAYLQKLYDYINDIDSKTQEKNRIKYK